MVRHELDTKLRIFQEVADRYGLSRGKVESIWESQFSLVHDVIKNKSVPFEKYPSILLLGFGKFYCTHGRLARMKKWKERQDESI